jgi:biopolymer transport protein ExbD
MRRKHIKPFKNLLPDTTPLADLTLILLCFFLLCGNLKDFRAIPVEIPIAVPLEICDMMEGDITLLDIVVDKKENLFLEIYLPQKGAISKTLILSSLEESDKILLPYVSHIKDSTKKVPIRIFLKADKETKAGTISKILGMLQNRNINRITFIINGIKPFPKEILQQRRHFD